jgi:16S rRNA (uracil1498-N3)-methyltransferase
VNSGAADELRRSAAHAVVESIDMPVLDDPDRHHLFRVLRLRDGERVSVTDGRGSWRMCVVVGGDLEVDGEPSCEPRRSDQLTIALAIPKAERPEWIVQKLTEIGIDRILLLHTARSVVRWDPNRAARHLEKLRRVAVEGAQQSRRVWLPELVGPVPAVDVLGSAVVAEPGGRTLAGDDRTVAIGPEGGWTDDELGQAVGRVSLGPTILRVETAALVAATLMVAGRRT